MSNLANDIYMLIVSHTKWKKRLQEQINTESNELGKMLGESTEFYAWIKAHDQFSDNPHYQAVIALYQQFQDESDKIISSVLDGNKETALKAMDYGSDYERLSQQLVQQIIAWHDEVSKSSSN